MKNKIKVLSLFDGISCGLVALSKLGVNVERYVAYEIDEYAVSISKYNFPFIEHKGDVFNGDYTKYKGFDLLLGGSPCTFWSISKRNREITPDGEGGKLFMQYVRALHESKCKYFLYENNYSIHKDIKDFISSQLGVQPIMINSALVSGQQRKRCYWTNIPNIIQPEDKHILLQDILESGISWLDKSYAYTTRCQAATFKDTLTRHRHTMIAEPVPPDVPIIYKDDTAYIDSSKPIRVGQIGKGGQGQRIYSVKGKSVTLSANGGGQGAKTGLYKIDLPDGNYMVRKLTPVEAERLQTLPDNYTAFGMDSNNKIKEIKNTRRYTAIGNGWTVDVIAWILKNII